MTKPVISVEPTFFHATLSNEIEANLLASLADTNTQSTNTTILLSAKDDAGQLVGGVYGSTSYGWLLVKLLWVSEQARNGGIGRQLMLAAEEHSKKIGCHSAWLDTSNDQARQFYLRLGYSVFGLLDNLPDNEPVDHQRWFMKKAL